jgi:hypothetical protein
MQTNYPLTPEILQNCDRQFDSNVAKLNALLDTALQKPSVAYYDKHVPDYYDTTRSQTMTPNSDFYPIHTPQEVMNDYRYCTPKLLINGQPFQQVNSTINESKNQNTNNASYTYNNTGPILLSQEKFKNSPSKADVNNRAGYTVTDQNARYQSFERNTPQVFNSSNVPQDTAKSFYNSNDISQNIVVVDNSYVVYRQDPSLQGNGGTDQRASESRNASMPPRLSYNSNTSNGQQEENYNVANAAMLSAQNNEVYLMTPNISNQIISNRSSVRKRKEVKNTVDKAVVEVQKTMELMNKFTTPEIIEKLNESADGQRVLRHSLRASVTVEESTTQGRKSIRLQNASASPSKKEQLQHIFEDIVTVKPNKIFASTATSPSKVVSVYQVVSEEYEDGTKYNGEKLLGKRHGKGLYYYKEGYFYDGSWEDDKISGYGVLWLDQDVRWYEGEWSDNNFDGNGVLYNAEPSSLNQRFDGTDFLKLGKGWQKYQGVFRKGKKNGFGKLYLLNGDVFVGHFVNDTIHGRGSYTKFNQKPAVGMWDCNKLAYYF